MVPGAMGVKGSAEELNSEITLPVLGFDLATFRSQAQSPNTLSYTPLTEING